MTRGVNRDIVSLRGFFVLEESIFFCCFYVWEPFNENPAYKSIFLPVSFFFWSRKK